jgi:translation initiation factor 2 beta subunit (eIF-2beta)/eIF-5
MPQCIVSIAGMFLNLAQKNMKTSKVDNKKEIIIKSESVFDSIDYFEVWISEVIQNVFYEPRSICICGQFEKSGIEEMYFFKCKNCGGWMSLKRIYENGS